MWSAYHYLLNSVRFATLNPFCSLVVTNITPRSLYNQNSEPFLKKTSNFYTNTYTDTQTNKRDKAKHWSSSQCPMSYTHTHRTQQYNRSEIRKSRLNKKLYRKLLLYTLIDNDAKQNQPKTETEIVRPMDCDRARFSQTISYGLKTHQSHNRITRVKVSKTIIKKK